MKGRIAWNKGRKLTKEQRLQISATMSGRTLSEQHKKRIAESQRKRLSEVILSEETKRKISEKLAARTLTSQHKQKIAKSQKRRLADVRMCSQCSVKSKWMYGVLIPSISEYLLTLCDNCLLSQYHGLSQEDKMTVSILS